MIDENLQADIEKWFKQRKIKFIKRTDYFHSVSGMCSATDTIQDIQTNEFFEFEWIRDFFNGGELCTKFPRFPKKLAYNYEI